MGKINFLILLFAAVLCCNSCKLYKVTYSTTGASISPDVKTFSVDYFPNKAPLVVAVYRETDRLHAFQNRLESIDR